MLRIHRPSPALVIAVLALFVALSGSAVAAGIVPLASLANNAKKLQGKTAVQVAALAPAKPATSAAGLVAVKSAPWSLGGDQENTFTVACDAGQKASGGGYDNPSGVALAFDSKPGSDGASWSVDEANLSSSAGASGNVYVVCVK